MAFGGGERTQAAQRAERARRAACERASALVLGVAKLRELIGSHPAHAPEAAVICRETGVSIARALSLPVRRGAHLRARLPVAAAEHALHVLARAGRTVRIRYGAGPVVIWVVDV